MHEYKTHHIKHWNWDMKDEFLINLKSSNTMDEDHLTLGVDIE